MKKLNSLIVISVFFMISCLFLSCQIENTGPIVTDSEVEFVIQAKNLKNSQGYSLSDADKVVLTILNTNYSKTKYTASEHKIEQMNGGYYTQKIVLKNGDYYLTGFLILNSAGETIFATPLANSQEAQNVELALPIAFSVTKDATTPVTVEVLSTEKKTPADFGLSHFPIVEVKTFDFLIGVVDKANASAITSKLTVSNAAYSYVQNLAATLNNVVSVKDGLSNYTLVVEKAEYITYSHTFTLAEIKAYSNENANDALLIELEKGATEIVTDVDGNQYNVVEIGTQIWMAENLKTTQYNDGSQIINVTDDAAWPTAGPAYCWYTNDAANKATYGALYNWYAVDPVSNGNKNICPADWHVPTDAEWKTLTDFLGGESVAGGKMKESGTAHWATPNTGADNSSGFTALSGGYRSYSGMFNRFGYYGYWWSSTKEDATDAWGRSLFYSGSSANRGNGSKSSGFSVRCLRD